jgi:hypothetical protein
MAIAEPVLEDLRIADEQPILLVQALPVDGEALRAKQLSTART